ncbi:MAG TPA: hypothetical protein VIF09_17420 [Polyangiaceae bacterium]
MRRALFALAVASVACAGHNGGEPLGANSPGIIVKPLDTPRSGLPGGPKPAVVAKSHLCGEIERKALGPFTARYAAGGLVAWIETAKIGGGQELRVVPTGVDGAPLAEPRVVTRVPQEATQLFVRPAGGTRGGWLVAWSALLDRGESLSIVGLAPDGSDRIKATDVQRTSDHVKWADMVPVPRGSVMLWAEETPSGSANVLSVGVDSDGKPRGLPTRVARDVVGWATARTDDGVGLALVTGPAGDKAGPGSLSWVRLDGEGHPVTAPVAVGTQPTVSSDVDAVAVPGGWLLAWTDRTREDAQVMLATVDAAGHVKGPRRAMDAVGGTTLAALATGPAGTALLWQEPRGRARDMRTLHMATVTTSGEPAAQPMTAFAVASRSIPELAATEHGFALLAVARSCVAGEHVGACDGPEMPLVVRLDARLSAVQTEPLYVGLPRRESSLGWGLRCAGDRCVALAATGESPTPVYTVELSPRESPFAPPSVPPPPVDAARATGLVTVASGQPFTQVDATTLGRTTLLATLTTAVDTIPKGQKKVRRGGLVVVRPFDTDGQPLGESTLLTSRALPVGGVSIAPGGKPEDGAVVAWVARDSDDPQVHLSHVDAAGKKLGEVQLTEVKGDASDVAVAWAGDGWIVAWVDGRDGNGEVYAVKVGRNLEKAAREERVTKAPGDAGDVAIAVKGETAWLAWSDPRESPREGVADVYATTLRTRDAKKTGEDVRVLATAGHSRSPEIAPAGDGAVVLWIEDSPNGLDGPAAAMAARLDGKAHVVGAAHGLGLSDTGRPTDLALLPAGDGLHAVVARTSRDEVTLDGLALTSMGALSGVWPIVDADAPGSFDVALALTPEAVFYDDIGATPSDHRVRRAALSWGR